MVIDVAGNPLWVSGFGGVYEMTSPPVAPSTATHVADLPQAPSRMARDASYAYVTTTSAVYAVPLAPIDAGPPILTLAENESSPFGVTVDAERVYWTAGSAIRATAVPPPW